MSNRVKRVAFFSRVSTMEQHTSIENQEKIFQQWLERNNDCVMHAIYEDEGISGAKGYKRKEWLRMLGDAEQGKFDIIVAKSYSRFGRNQRETLSAIADLRKANVRVVFLEDNLDSEVDSSKFGLFAWLAEQEAQKSSERIKTVWDSYNAQGKVHVTLAPYGYDYDKEAKNFVINSSEVETVKEIFSLYLQGNGLNKIANILTERRVATKRGGKWAGQTIRSILENEFYTGTLIQGKSRTLDVTMKESRPIPEEEWYRHSNNHEAIITREDYYKVKEKLHERSSKAKNTYTKEHANSKASRHSNASIFSNILKCGECGATMTIKRKKRSNYVPYYNCIDYDMYGTKKCNHSSNMIKQKELIEEVREELDDLAKKDFKQLKAIVNSFKKTKAKNKSYDKELAMIEKQLQHQIKLSSNLLSLYTDGSINKNTYLIQNEQIEKSIDEFIKRKEELNTIIKSSKDKGNIEELKQSITSLLEKDVEEWTNAQLKTVIEQIKIYTNGQIIIHLKYYNKL